MNSTKKFTEEEIDFLYQLLLKESLSNTEENRDRAKEILRNTKGK